MKEDSYDLVGVTGRTPVYPVRSEHAAFLNYGNAMDLGCIDATDTIPCGSTNSNPRSKSMSTFMLRDHL